MSTELQTQQGGELMERPNYLSTVAKEDWGVDGLQQYVSPPYIKIIQSQAKAPYSEYDPGTVMAVPQNLELFRPGQAFHVTPVFMYTEFVLTNPYPMKDSLSFIRERSFDPEGDLAAHARDFQNRTCECPEAPVDKRGQDKFQCAYYEHINFLCLIHEHEVFKKLPIVFTFRSGQFKAGKLFAGLISMRQGPICAGVYKVYTEINKDENYGFVVTNPTDVDAWLPEDEFNQVFEAHKQFKELHKRNLIQVNYGEESTEPAVDPDAPSM